MSLAGSTDQQGGLQHLAAAGRTIQCSPPASCMPRPGTTEILARRNRRDRGRGRGVGSRPTENSTLQRVAKEDDKQLLQEH
eukprot:scaffold4409_cov369-Prasinococcus_capsulatus_cf.AAC.7